MNNIDLEEFFGSSAKKAKQIISFLSDVELKGISKIINKEIEKRDKIKNSLKEEERLKIDKAKEIIDLMQKMNISMDEVNKNSASGRVKLPPKYIIKKDGENYYWSGVGAPPRVFKNYISEHGKHALSDLEIKNIIG